MSEEEPAAESIAGDIGAVPALVERLEARRIRRSEGVREAICRRMDAHIDVRIDPDGMTRPDRHVLEFATPAHRPRTSEEELPGMREAVEHMGRCMPQFFLRNILRHTMDTDEEFDPEPRHAEVAAIHEETLRSAREETVRSHRFKPDTIELSGETLRIETRRGRALLQEEDWSRLLGREIRENLPGPIWKYFPEDGDLERYGDEYSEVIDLETEDSGSEAP